MGSGVAAISFDIGFELGEGLLLAEGEGFESEFEGEGGRIDDAEGTSFVGEGGGEGIVTIHLALNLLIVVWISLASGSGKNEFG